ncbi:hypothetical protein CVV43_03685 [Candidatus Saccharibacteria bacterium HGW-Saccharibacteria-1]|jgi:hypothetical protein|nr:MAG: hypothetical protein CVV43_03685 [Candidatus Saccharibacteria bacterium HGW-Saccharibacteria-1]
MVDTIKIVLGISDPMKLDCGRFSPLTIPQLMRGRGFNKTNLNMAKQYAKLGRYMPRLTLYKRFNEIAPYYELGVEFSAPKLLLGNNFEELTGADLPLLLEALQRALDELVGYVFSIEDLRKAPIIAFHPSKNIVLPHITACRAVINVLAKLDITMVYDMHRTDYRDGYILHLHTNTIDIAFYDKLADLRTARKSTKRAYEKEPTLQSKIVDKLIIENEKNILRYEIRLNKRIKIKQTYPELNEWTLNSMFNEEICQKPLLYHWQKITKSIDLISMDADKPYEILHNLIVSKNGKTLRQNLAITAGLMITNQVGYRDFQHLVSGTADTSTWYRLKKELVFPKRTRLDWVLAIDKALHDFNPVQETSLTKHAFDKTVDFGKLSIIDFEKELNV